MNRFVLQLGIGLLLFMFSMLATWYEGSEILDRPFEWKYSTPFSGQVLKASDISPLDYFVYAIKFKPTFPALVALSCIYLFVVVGYYAFKDKKRIFTSFLSILAVGLLVLGWDLTSSTTGGAQVMSCIFLLTGALCIVTGLLYFFASLNRTPLFYKK